MANVGGHGQNFLKNKEGDWNYSEVTVTPVFFPLVWPRNLVWWSYLLEAFYPAGHQFATSITISFAFFTGSGYELSNHTAVRGREETLISQGIGGHMIGRLDRHSPADWDSHPELKCFGASRRGTASTVANCNREDAQAPSTIKILLTFQGHLLQRTKSGYVTALVIGSLNILQNRLVMMCLCRWPWWVSKPNLVYWEWLSYSEPFDWLSTGHLLRWPIK